MLEAVVSNGVIRNRCPVDLHPLVPVPVTTDADVTAVVARARAAQPKWGQLGFEQRAVLMKRAGKLMLQRRQEVLELLHDEAGKTPGEVLMGESLGALQFISDWIAVARPYLKPKKLPISRVAFPGKSGVIESVPRGVVGIISPWNFPLANFFKPVFAALISGNAVVLKPSEHSPRMGAWLVKTMGELLPVDVLTCVQGDAWVGQQLIRSGIDALTFTGSTQTGRKVAKLAAEQMIPVSLELGGKDAAIVLADCDFDRTVAGVMHWALTNAGQSCGGIERVFVENAIADRFVERLAAAVAALRVSSGDPQSADVGPLIQQAQLQVVEEHVGDAIAHGAKVVCGGKRSGKGLWFEPTVLDHCADPEMKVLTEPTFGPVIPIVRVKNADEAVALTNACDYGLNASVWTKDLERGNAIARQLQVGTAFINNHAFTGAIPAAPWTGVKSSGYGIANSTFALGHYTRPRTVVTDKNTKADAWWFPIDATMEELGHRLAEVQVGNVLAGLKVPLLIAERQRTVLRFVREGIHKAAEAAPKKGLAARAFGAVEAKLFPALAKLGKTGLTQRERTWARVTMETIYVRKPGDPTVPVPREEADQYVDDFYAALPFPSNLGLRAAIWSYGLAPLVTRPGLKTLEQLADEEQQETIQAFAQSKSYLVRQLSLLMKTTGGMKYAATSRLRSVGAVPIPKNPRARA